MSTEALTTNTNNGLSFAASDIELPRLNVIQKMSEIEGEVGSVVLDKEFEILKLEERTNVVVVSAVKRWKENVPFDSDVIPKFANTEADARDLAKDSEYEILEFAEIALLIPQIGGDDTAFPFPIGDSNYAIGRITVQKDAYRCTFKRLVTNAMINPDVPLNSRFWSFGSENMTKGRYTWAIPTLNFTKVEVPAEVVEFVNRLTGGAN